MKEGGFSLSLPSSLSASLVPAAIVLDEPVYSASGSYDRLDGACRKSACLSGDAIALR
jgi:hypothetical protein